MTGSLRNPEEEAKEYGSRYRWLMFIVVASTLVIFGRLWYLQIMKGKELREFSEKNRVKETKIPAPRGIIVDRQGEILVENLPGFEVTITPQYATQLKETAQAVGTIIGMDPQKIHSMVKKSRRRNGPFYMVRIKENLNLDEVARLKRLRIDHPGLNINEGILRHYALNENGAQLLGYVGEISKSQIKRYNKKYRGKIHFEQGDIIGKSGLESVWEEDLRGTHGLSFVEVDAHGRSSLADAPVFMGLQMQDPNPGHNLVLTIDKEVQEAAYKAMQREDKIGPRMGGIVALKSDGEVLAWVNSPSFDPNEFSLGLSSDLWTQLINDPFKPLRNKVIQDHYPPGSTFKPIVALAALQEKVITPHTKVYAPGFLKFGRRIYHDASRAGHGQITVVDALERSSNVFFYKMGIALGIDRIAEYAKLLGIGSLTGIEFTHEAAGHMPTKEWKRKALGEEWQPGENLSNAIGQGFVLTTALQMAVAFNIIGQEGKHFKPFLVKKITDHNGVTLRENHPDLLADISQPNEDGLFISKENFKVVKEGLRRVANGARGTARWYKIPGIEMSGKTGTVQVKSFSADQIYTSCLKLPLRQRHHGWFIGYAPSDKPEITVAVLAEHGCAGSSGGAPVARDVILAYMKKYHPDWLKRPTRKAKAQTSPVTQADRANTHQPPKETSL